jgi:hypothetical protein
MVNSIPCPWLHVLFHCVNFALKRKLLYEPVGHWPCHPIDIPAPQAMMEVVDNEASDEEEDLVVVARELDGSEPIPDVSDSSLPPIRVAAEDASSSAADLGLIPRPRPPCQPRLSRADLASAASEMGLSDHELRQLMFSDP